MYDYLWFSVSGVGKFLGRFGANPPHVYWYLSDSLKSHFVVSYHAFSRCHIGLEFKYLQ